MRLSLLCLSLLFLLSCDKDSASAYPDCFVDLESTHTVISSYGSSATYVELTDSSALFFGLNDEELEIGTSCKTLNPSDLINWNTVRYYEWGLHPDSVPPDFSSDVWTSNTSSFRTWDLSSGTISAIVSKPACYRTEAENFLISIQLLNGVFDRSASGLDEVIIDELILKDVSTGGFGPG